jgi:hypothetical protein
LCVCVPQAARAAAESAGATAAGAGLTWIGRVTDGPSGLTFAGSTGELSGYEHSP